MSEGIELWTADGPTDLVEDEPAAPASPYASQAQAPAEEGETPDDGALSSRQIARIVFPDLANWAPVLDLLGISFEQAVGLAARADAGCWSLGHEILAAGAATEAQLCEAMALTLGLPFERNIGARRLIVSDEEAMALLRARWPALPVRSEGRGGRSTILLAPTGWSPAEMTSYLAASPKLKERLRIVPPSGLRALLWVEAKTAMLRSATLSLFEAHPLMSARFVLNPWQGVLVGVALVLLPAAFLLAPVPALSGLHAAATLFFMACVILRVAAIRGAPHSDPAFVPRWEDAELPVYSILVPLYRESEVVPELLKSLEAIDWPAGRLEVKLICEEDDHETIAAIEAERPHPFVEIVRVPAGLPRTKPKALNFALPVTSGEFLVLYDAEDRPDPLQLREAFRRFRDGGPELACLQAPLVVANAGETFLSRMFAVEYAALFRALLPFLARHSAFLPLGGTSSHFRRSALERTHGWDPFNVTEDADLGLRLARLGFRTGTLTRPTLEDGPEKFAVWLPQRSRWFKGWVQTWLVHMREPGGLARELKPASFVVAQILLAGTIASALVHPVLVATFIALGAMLATGQQLSPTQSGLMLADIANITCGYLAFILLAWHGSSKAERRGFGRVVAATPIYWMMLSIAAWNALWQLWRQPHHWNKTPHKPARTPLAHPV